MWYFHILLRDTHPHSQILWATYWQCPWSWANGLASGGTESSGLCWLLSVGPGLLLAVLRSVPLSQKAEAPGTVEPDVFSID